ncbi:hypothetical protein OU415_25370, partial [Saccharopolyspora sp. WRP15-2]|nr:hypothetical protein [Saccharopolyspora oryzae]
MLGYAVAVFVTAIAVSSAHHGTAAAPVAAPAPAPAPAAQFLPAEATSTAPKLHIAEPEPVATVEAEPHAPETTSRPTRTA